MISPKHKGEKELTVGARGGRGGPSEVRLPGQACNHPQGRQSRKAASSRVTQEVGRLAGLCSSHSPTRKRNRDSSAISPTNTPIRARPRLAPRVVRLAPAASHSTVNAPPPAPFAARTRAHAHTTTPHPRRGARAAVRRLHADAGGRFAIGSPPITPSVKATVPAPFRNRRQRERAVQLAPRAYPRWGLVVDPIVAHGTERATSREIAFKHQAARISFSSLSRDPRREAPGAVI